MHRLTSIAALALAAPLAAQQSAPQPMGVVPTQDALVTGGLEVRGDSARLLTNASITAYDHTAAITLQRGGEVLVCSTSQFHLLHSGTGDSLLFGLDRGALELHTNSSPQDVILTPDIRFTLEHPGHFDLRLRVTPNGDTCVENAGASAPVLTLTDAFNSATYRLIPGQHVLFEHGDLRQVVDKEHSSCGCPAPSAPPQQVVASTPGQKITPSQAAAQNPFPTAASVGLAPTAPPSERASPGETHTQVSTSLAYDANYPDAVPPAIAEPVPNNNPASGSAAGSATGVGSSTSSTPPGAHDIFHAIGHLFHKLFHHGNKPVAPPQ